MAVVCVHALMQQMRDLAQLVPEGIVLIQGSTTATCDVVLDFEQTRPGNMLRQTNLALIQVCSHAAKGAAH